MEKEENLSNVCCPSFELECRTRAFNKYIWWFVSMISMFTFILVFAAFHNIMTSILGLVSTTVKDYIFVFQIIPIIASVVFGYQCVQMMAALRTSYKLENGCLVKGYLQKTDEVYLSQLIIDAGILWKMVDRNLDPDTVLAGNATLNWNKITKLIRLNMNPEFVAESFDTDIYKKKTYYNPKLTKVTKYSLIFTCENKKKLVVPRIYEGLYPEPDGPESTFVGRIMKRTVLVFLIAFLIASVDLVIGYAKNDSYVGNISDTMDMLEQNLNNFGYEAEEINEKVYHFEKEINNGDETSSIKYYFDKHGNITNVDFQLYYDANSEQIAEELTYIISTLNAEIDSEEQDEFIEAVLESVAGNYSYKKIQTENATLRIGKSGKYIDIHSY